MSKVKEHKHIWMAGQEYGQIICAVCGEMRNPFKQRQSEKGLDFINKFFKRDSRFKRCIIINK